MRAVTITQLRHREPLKTKITKTVLGHITLWPCKNPLRKSFKPLWIHETKIKPLVRRMLTTWLSK